MFQSIYELFLGQNNNPIYVNDIFAPVGTTTTLVALILAVIFYVGLGRWKAIFHRVSHWSITLIIMALFGFFYATYYAKDRADVDDMDSYMTSFGGVNALLAVVLFFLFSLALKNVSIFAKRTPF